MSTYLVAFIVSKFANISAPDVQVGKNSVWSRPALINQGEYSFGIAPKIIKEMNELTNILYTTFISKLDQIAIPDLMAEAMENWGLVTYTYLYYFVNYYLDKIILIIEGNLCYYGMKTLQLGVNRVLLLS